MVETVMLKGVVYHSITLTPTDASSYHLFDSFWTFSISNITNLSVITHEIWLKIKAPNIIPL